MRCRHLLQFNAAVWFVARAVQAVSFMTSEKVQVRVYGEAGCGYTRKYLTGPVRHALADPATVKVMDFEFSPFGNAFFVLPECQRLAKSDGPSTSGCGGGGYSSSLRQCFDQRCGAGAAKRLSNCFTGGVVCQHGFKECAFDRYFACAKDRAATKSGGSNVTSYMPFVLCMVDKYSETLGGDPFKSLLHACADLSGLEATELEACYRSDAGTKALAKEAASTPDHPGVPYVTVNGYALAESYDVFGLQVAVHSAYRGDKPPVGAILREGALYQLRRQVDAASGGCNSTDAEVWRKLSPAT